jgi:hypothetical protein
MDHKHRTWLPAVAVLALAALACNISTGIDVATPDSSLGTVSTPDESLAATPTFEPTGAGGCSYAAAFVADVNVPDNTEFPPDTPFTKTWRIQNTGTCDWGSGTQLAYVSGDALAGPTAVPVHPVPAGTNADIDVEFAAPGSPGTYKSYWQMQTPEGTLFGDLIFVQIVVPGPTAAAPVSQPEWGIYRNGDHGPAVYAIQYLLNAEGYTLTVDGAYGPKTTAAVKNFQTAKGLASDGIVGPNTWTKLIANHTVKAGSHGDDVRAVQYLLANVYGYSLAVDGVFGPDTNNAVRDFQAAHGLPADGIVGSNTWKALITGA